MCFLDCHQPCLKIPSSPLNRPALLKKLKCLLNNLISHYDSLSVFLSKISLALLNLFFFFSHFPLFICQNLPPFENLLSKKILPSQENPSSFLLKKKTMCPIKTLLIFPCIEKPKSLFFFGTPSFFSFSQNELILIYFPFFHVFFYYLR